MSLSTPEQALKQLAGIFSTRHKHSQTLEIEILPPEFGPLLHDGCSVGITKKVLVQAFVAARRVFFDKRDGNGNGRQFEEEEEENRLRASEILLLFAPEHLTACNWRKRRLVWTLQNTNTDTDTTDVAHRQDILENMDRELTLMTTFQCSPLHRHTKSPTLWQHRFWVLSQILTVRGRQCQQQTEPETLQSILRSELSIVLRAGELHPRNYYAFNYMRQLLHTILLHPGSTTDENKDQNFSSTSLLDNTVSWCLAHPRDISGWMFVLYLLEQALPDRDRRDVQTRVINMVVRFALDIGWVGESLWTFVDLAVRSTGVDVQLPVGGEGNDDKITALSGRSWKSWLARAESYWAAADMSSQERSQA